MAKRYAETRGADDKRHLVWSRAADRLESTRALADTPTPAQPAPEET